MDSDDDDLPEVSFDSSPRSEANEQAASTSPAKASSYSFHLAKINAFSRKIEENCKFETNKAELEDLIRQDGFHFDERAQPRIMPQNDADENLELNAGQQEFLNKMKICYEDPVISFKPELENLFDLNACRIVFHEYPIEAFTRNFAANLSMPNLVQSNIINQVSQAVEQVFFFKFFDQIPNDTYKNAVLDCLFFNIPWFASNLKALTVSEILSEVINSQRSTMSTGGCWRINGNMVYKFLKSLGLKTERLESSLPEVFRNVQAINKSCSETSSIGRFVVEPQEVETISEDNFKIAIKCLLDLLFLSLRPLPNGISLYSVPELDLMFVLLIYLFLDENFDLEFSTDHRLVVQLLLSNYADQQWDHLNDKSKSLCTMVFNAYGLDTPDDYSEEGDKSEQLVLNDKSSNVEQPTAPSSNLLYHRIYHLISSLGYSLDKKPNKFRFDLAYFSACNLLMSFEEPQAAMDTSASASEDEQDRTLLHVRKHLTDNYLDYQHLATMAQEKLAQIYMTSSYSMYNLIRLLEVVIADISTSTTDDSLKIRVLEQLKDAVQAANRLVKDKLEYQGRMQVKIMNSNFISKCDFYLKEFTKKGSKYSNLILDENKHRHLIKTDPGDNDLKPCIHDQR